MTARTRAAAALCGLLATTAVAALRAHNGPPFPIVPTRIVGPYQLSVWTDPDTTDDGSAAGRFWVTLQPAGGGRTLPAETRAEVSIRPLDRQGPPIAGRAAPVGRDPSRQFVALVMDHEGPFAVRVTIEGPLGAADVDAQVDATYDLRPSPVLLIVYAVPFLLVGFLWVKLLARRRRARGGH